VLYRDIREDKIDRLSDPRASNLRISALEKDLFIPVMDPARGREKEREREIEKERYISCSISRSEREHTCHIENSGVTRPNGALE